MITSFKQHQTNKISYDIGDYVYSKLFGGKFSKILNRTYTHEWDPYTIIEYYNDYTDEFETFKIHQSDIERKLTESEIEEYLDFKKEYKLRKEGEIYNL